MKISKGIDYLNNKVNKRFGFYLSLFDQHPKFEWLVEDPELRSKTVITLKYNNPTQFLKRAKEMGLLIGSGYGNWKKETIRIANFPAIKSKEVERLGHYIEKNYN